MKQKAKKQQVSRTNQVNMPITWDDIDRAWEEVERTGLYSALFNHITEEQLNDFLQQHDPLYFPTEKRIGKGRN